MENETVKKIIAWIRQAQTAIEEAGGNPEYIFPLFPEKLIEHLACNEIHLIYMPEELD